MSSASRDGQPCRSCASRRKPTLPTVRSRAARIAEVMTLLPGDVIATGTSAGVGPLVPGDRVEVRIEGIGSLKNTVVKP
ncbi:MAG: hypothetical protein DMD99_08230 [Candidatus Rokuibacteriota bacterium]|nr:MAG: hypothetical protein DMD99_08230 [Candidatus Rokubacteria bacterium]